MILVAYRSADQELVKLVLHLVGMLGKLQPTCRPDMNVMLTDDLKVLIRSNLLLLQKLQQFCLYTSTILSCLLHQC